LQAGIAKGNLTAELFADNAFDKRAEVYRFSECTIFGTPTSLCAGQRNLRNPSRWPTLRPRVRSECASASASKRRYS
jgi:hypothetical protein